MLHKKIIFSFASFFMLSQPIWANGFLKNYETTIQGNTPSIKGNLSSYHFVFVKGFLNGAIPQYFSENIKVLTSLGVYKNRIHILSPNSNKQVLENAEMIEDYINEIPLKDQDKIILIGHSKGGAEVLAFALTHGDTVQHRVHKIYMIQACLQGSPYADYLLDLENTSEPSENIPNTVRGQLMVLKKMRRVSDPFLNKGLTDMSVDKADSIWNPLLEDVKNDAHTRKIFQDKLYYITSHKKPEEMASLVSASGWYMWGINEANDGLVPTKSQSRPEVGEVLADLDVDHAALVTSRPTSNVSSIYREALMNGILGHLLSSHLGSR